jgi:3-hexulose-6-phosphate synthase/6-phospho-3-hexuloisomerase
VARTTALYKRTTADRVKEMLLQVSTANLSDGHHRAPCLEGIRPIMPGLKLVGRAVTVRTASGDWSKPVQAIDVAKPGEVIVIDAGGRPPAVWGELATHSCHQKQVAGVVIDGAIRDTTEILRLKFPAFARHITSHAGDPDGVGMINVPINVGGLRVEPGDWIAGDDDGVMAIPQARAVEMTNYAMDCLERENRVRGEIDRDGKTLGQVLNLSRWDRQSR